MNFEPGKWYRFHPGTGKHPSSPWEHHVLTLKYLRDKHGDHRTIFHIFQWRGGALECFTDVQAGDYHITEK